jgi:transposase InsO family protein
LYFGTSGLSCLDHSGLAAQYGRYGYRRVTGLLAQEGWAVSRNRVERLWKQEGLRVPARQPKRGRLWLADGSCVRLRPAHRHHVWSWDFVMDRTDDGRPLKLLEVLDGWSPECLASHMARRIRTTDVLQVFADLMQMHGVPTTSQKSRSMSRRMTNTTLLKPARRASNTE